MTIGGLMKLTLLDFPGKVACTVFTAGCNFRCPFCHNASLVKSPSPAMSEDEFFAFLKKRSGILDGVCISGGEPTLNADLVDFITKIKELGYSVKLDTNGSDPETLKQLTDAFLIDHVALDIKNSPSKYKLTCGGVNVLDRVRTSLRLLALSGISYELRTTIVRELHDDEDIREIGKWIQGAPAYYLQKFTDSGDILSEGMSAADDDDMERFLSIAREYVPTAKLRGSDA